MVSGPLGHYAFLYRKIFFGARNWLLLNQKKMENMKGWHCKNNYNLQKQLWLLTIFAQHSIVDV